MNPDYQGLLVMLPKTCRLGLLLALAGCGSAEAKGLDGNDDMHCAIVAWHVEQNTDGGAANRNAKGAAVALRNWYFSKVSEAQMADKERVNSLLVANKAQIIPTITKCHDRAMSDKGYSGFSAWTTRNLESQI